VIKDAKYHAEKFLLYFPHAAASINSLINKGKETTMWCDIKVLGRWCGVMAALKNHPFSLFFKNASDMLL